MRTKLIVALGCGGGAVVLWVGTPARGPAGDGSSQTTYDVAIMAVSIWAVTAMVAALSHHPSMRRARATTAGIVGVFMTAVILGIAAHFAKTPGLTTECVRDGVSPHRLTCNDAIRDYPAADQHAFLVGIVAVLVGILAGLVYARILARDAEPPPLPSRPGHARESR